MDSITFGTLKPDGSLVDQRTIKTRDIAACRHLIFVASHYREDGSCKCDDATERARMIAEWEYEARDFDGIPLREEA